MSIILTNDHPLAALRQSVERCRVGRAKARFPDDLKWQIVCLLGQYPPSEIARTLGIGANCLSRWKRQFAKHDINLREHSEQFVSASQDGFVTLPPSGATTAGSIHSDTFELNLVLQTEHDPQRVSLKANITLAQWQQMLPLISQALLA